MAHNVPEIIICLLIISCVGTIYIFSHLFQGLLIVSGAEGTYFHKTEYSWIFRLCINCFGYASIFIPGFLIHKYIRKTKYLERSNPGPFSNLIESCFGENEQDRMIDNVLKNEAEVARSISKECMLLITCFIGLMGSYLTWGVLQEKVMTQMYENETGTKAQFKDSQFLVFINRILAFLLSLVYILASRQPRHKAPIYKYAFCSFSNILSAWCQYEALKYVSFPTQVLAKSCKIIPVMIMGKVVSRSKYDYYEYVTAALISVGMIFFMLGSSDENKNKTITTISGIILLASYMLFDSFTSNWQGALFKSYSMSPIQMMCGVNLFSCLFTGVSLLQQSSFLDSLQFMINYPKFIVDCITLSICSAVGQLFIFFTIATFGPVVFTIIMTLRQGIAILLSCLIYNHHISSIGIIGIIVVFMAVFLRIYCKQRLRALRKKETSYKTRSMV